MLSEPHENDDDRVTGTAQIAGLLRRLQEEHALLTASFPDSTEIFNTTIVGVDLPHGHLLLDELNTARGHEQVRPGTRLRLETRLHGVDTRFLVEVLEVGSDSEGVPFYRAAFPESMIHRQRRRHHRVPIKLTLDAGVALSDDSHPPIRGRLSDLSVGGLGGVVTSGDPLVVGARYTCTLQLPRQPAMQLQVEIRFAQAETGRRQQKFGAMILGISPQDQRRLERTVMDLERELRRSG